VYVCRRCRTLRASALLHRAYAPLAERGMRFLASHQDDAKTLEWYERADSKTLK
jgi:hypothetical protein